jgi:hypothetical protein
MNVMLVCPIRDVFVDLVDTTGCMRLKEYIVDELKSYELVASYLHLYKKGYYTYIFYLPLED